LDITRNDEISAWFLNYKPHYCINCAAYTKVDQAEKNPGDAHKINVQGVENLVSACRENATTLIHISTDYVFDGKKIEGYLPTDKPNPINVYGKTKLEGERLIQRHMERYFIIRTSWLYSKKYGPNFYLTILEKARKGAPLSVIDTQRGCPTNAANLARHIIAMIQSGSKDYGVSHFTGGVPMTWFEFAWLILKEEGLLEKTSLKKAENYRSFAERPQVSILK
jgi:dTDP-4-dehydrorhamnose reductase